MLTRHCTASNSCLLVPGFSILLLLTMLPAPASALVITTTTTISAGDVSLDGQHIEVRGAQLTISGEHAFASLLVTNGGVVTHPIGETTGLHLTIAGDCSVDAASRIDVSGRGYAAGQGPGGAPGAGFNEAGGAGYGGTGASGARNVPGYTYGSLFEPAVLGSGGGANGGRGGGSIRLIVQGVLTVDGTILADGANAPDGGGGSGGSVWITAQELAGEGAIRAAGGNGSNSLRGAGGGGRVAIVFSQNHLGGTITACGGASPSNRRGGAGTVYLKGQDEPMGTVVLDNCGNTGARTDLVEGEESVDANVIVRGGAAWGISRQRPFNPTIAGDLTIAPDGAITVSGRGYTAGQGPGGAASAGFNEGGGAGYGGTGGNGNRNIGGTTYGSFLEPDAFGSGGAAAGGAGGGQIRLSVAGELTLDGGIHADGDGAPDGGGGSGGSVWVTTTGWDGSGSITANGGAGSNSLRGGGGGGRIAVYHANHGFSGVMTACGGGPANRIGGAGTVYTNNENDALGTLILDNCGQPWVTAGGRTDVVTSPVHVPAHVIVRNAAVWSHKPGTPFVASVDGDVTVELSASISADGRGSSPESGPGSAPGAGFNEAGGAGYGGTGGTGNRGPAGSTYGSFLEPVDLGSGGGAAGGAGGGAIKLIIAGALTVDGEISSTGNAASDGGGGSGGSIWLTTGTLDGAGAIKAAGGAGANSLRGGGGGGRVAAYFDVETFNGTMTACGGGPGNRLGGAGTVYKKVSAEPLGELIIDNCDQPLTSGRTDLVGPPEAVPGHLIVRRHGVLSHKRLTTMDLSIAGDVRIESEGFISADGRGYTAEQGPGLAPGAGFNEAGGAGYGGAGATGNRAGGGTTYGSFAAPVDFGSGGGAVGGAGGGSIQLAIAGGLTVDGTLSAKGDNAVDGGGGSGGSIQVTTAGLDGAGAITAAGGNGSTSLRGGGGGGRIAISFDANGFAGEIKACGGGPPNRVGGAGTVYLKQSANELADLIIDNCGQPATGARTDVVNPQELVRGNVIVRNAGVWSHKSGEYLDARVLGDLVVEPDGFVSALGRGFGATQGPGGAPSAGFNEAGGGGYGGSGGSGNRGPGGGTYGSVIEPVDLGSGGGSAGGAGGGRLRLSVQGTVRVLGLIGADGAPGSDGGGGSGGSVLITADRFEGQGLIAARGGNGSTSLRGGGGGGRIALFYNELTAFALEQIVVTGGSGFRTGEAGTIHLATGQAPVLETLTDESVPEGATYTRPPTFVRLGVPPFTFSLVNGPPGMQVDPLTGSITWPRADASGSPWTVAIDVENPFGTDTGSFQLMVVPSAPLIAHIPDGAFIVELPYVGPVPQLLQGSPVVTWSLVAAPAGTAIDAATGVVTWPTPVTEGNPHVFTIRATNALGSDDQSWRLTVQAPPLIAAIDDAVMPEGATYTGPSPGLLQGAPAPSWSLVTAPVGMTIHSQTGVVTWPNATATGSPHLVTIRATNVQGYDDASWLLTVEPAAPVIAALADLDTAVAVAFTGPLPTLLQGSPGITWSLVEPVPEGMTVDPSNGQVSWAAPAAEGSPYTVTLRAENAIGADEESFLLRVLFPPVIAAIPDGVIDEHTAYVGPTPMLEQGSAPVTWTLVQAPAWVTINAATGVVNWSLPRIEGSPHTITIRATNTVGSDEESWELLVNPVPPVIAPIADASIPADQPYTLNPSLLQGSAPVNWSLPAHPDGMSIDATTGQISWPAPQEAGSPHTVTLKAENVAGSDEKTFLLHVGFAPLIAEIENAVLAEGEAYTGPQPQLLGGSPPVTWSLVAGPPGMTIDPATGIVNWAKALASVTSHLVRIRAQNAFGSDTEDWELQVPVGYTATVSTDVTTAVAGTPVLLQGQAVRLPDPATPAANVPVTIRIRVQGTRRLITAQTNASGQFAALFQPLPTEAGVYAVGADHPAIPTDTTQDTFTLVGMRAGPAQSSLTIVPGASGMTPLVLRNLGDTSLAAVNVAVQGVPPGVDVQVAAPVSLAPLEVADVACTVTAGTDGSFQGPVTVRFESALGAVASHTLNLTVRPPQPVLEADPSALVASMVRGKQTIVPVVVTNVGGSATGPLNIQLPAADWLSVISPNPLPSLEPGVSGTVEFQLLPASDLTLGLYSGTIVVGQGPVSLTLPYAFTAVSEGKGDLRVIAEDEFTYWAPGNPRLEGAQVVLREPVTGMVLASGFTGPDGILFQDLTEAYYRLEVTAPEHQSASTTVLVVAGRERTIRPFLPREVVSYSWSVVPTTIEDVYRLRVEATFQTNVPAPVVTIDPAHVDLSTLGCDAQIDFTITNHGLITAQDVRFNIRSTERWELTPLVTEIGDLAAKTSIVVPVRFTNKLCPSAPGDVRLAAHEAAAAMSGGGCDHPVAQLLWTLICDIPRSYGAGVAFTQQAGSADDPSFGCPVGGSGIVVFPGEGEGAISINPVPFRNHPCDPCDFDRAVALAECLLGAIPGPVGCGAGIGSAGRSCFGAASNPSLRGAALCVLNGAGAAIGCLGGPVGSAIGLLICLPQIPDCPPRPDSGGLGDVERGLQAYTLLTGKSAALGSPNTELAAQYLDLEVQRALTLVDFWTYFYGHQAWLISDASETAQHQAWIQAFFAATAELGDGSFAVTPAEEAQLRALPLASHITQDDVTALLERWNRSVDYWSRGIFNLADVPAGESTDFIALDVYNAKGEAAASAADAVIEEGFTDVMDGVVRGVNALDDALSTPAEGVCARVRIRIDQEAVVSRNAFLATLEISNDSDARTIENIAVDVRIEELSGAPADDRFGISAPALTNLSDVSGGGSLGAGLSGRAEWTIIPARTAAPTEPVVYRVSGTFRYTLEGQEVIIPLFPDDITVLPDPLLEVDYFLERIVYSDDPFTDEIEPPVPFSLGMMVTNTGAGRARDFRITTAQPQIVDNEKGLLIAFKIIGSQVGAQPGTPSLTMNLGSIDPGARRVARWLMTSSLQGEFIQYEASFEHVNPLGIPGLSLIDSVNIHELTHVVRVDHPQDDGLPDFLVNDVVDLELLPDVIYGSDGARLPVRSLTEGELSNSINAPIFEATLTVHPVQAGWTYMRIDDPAGPQYRLAQVRRPDGSHVRLEDNAWRTRRTIRLAGQAPREEALLHVLDHVEAPGARSYTLVCEPVNGFSPADLDHDGTVDGVDWGLFLTARGHSQGDPAYNPRADLDGDGVVTLVDQQAWLVAYRAWLQQPDARPPTPVFLPDAYLGDMDGDKDVDRDDLAAFVRCAGGPAVPVADGCTHADFDSDGDVDQSDFGLLQQCYRGAGLRPPPECGRK